MPSLVTNHPLGLQPAQPINIEEVAAILILGLSNTGKSTFINRILDCVHDGPAGKPPHVRVRDGMSAMTDDVEEVTLTREHGRTVILVDTPGLDHTEMADNEVLESLAGWLRTSFESGIRIGAVLYFHDMSSDLVTSTMRRDVNILKQLCGPASLGAVSICTTKWCMVPPAEDALGRENELRHGLWSDLIKGGCDVQRAGSQEEAISLLEAVLQKVAKPLELAMQQELIRGISLARTGAGRALKGLPVKKSTANIRQHSRFSRTKKSTGQAPDPENKEERDGQGWTIPTSQRSVELPLDGDQGLGGPLPTNNGGNEFGPGLPKDKGKASKKGRNLAPSSGWDFRALLENLIKKLHNIKSNQDGLGKDGQQVCNVPTQAANRPMGASRMIEASPPSSMEGPADFMLDAVFGFNPRRTTGICPDQKWGPPVASGA